MTKKIMGIALTTLGAVGLIYSAMVYLGATEFSEHRAWAPFIIAIIFFVAGITLVNSLTPEEDR